jgi:Uma2 family endonuclease
MSTVVEHTKRVWTEADLEALPEDGYIHELVNGEIIVSPKNSYSHGDICAQLLTALRTYAQDHKLGAVWDSSTGFWMRNRNCRAPDVSFISKARLRGFRRRASQFFPEAPDLAVEILARSNTPAEIRQRLDDFFDSGTQLAWIIHPEEQFVEVCTSPIQRRTLGPGAFLDGQQLLPGFRFPIADLFKEWDWE